MSEQSIPDAGPLQDRDYSRIVDEAALWLERNSEAALSADDRSAFETWLLSDIRNGAAYDRLARTALDASALGRLRAFADPDTPFPSWRTPVAAGVRWLSRPAPLLGVGAAAAAVILAIIMAPVMFVAPAQYETQIAEIEPLGLEDGSIVTLGANSAVDTDFSDATRREVNLRAGQAFFEVAHNRARPFYVVAGDVSVRVVGTKFDVRRGEHETTISVLEGAVAVSPEGGPVRVLRAGERATISHRALFGFADSPTPVVATVAPPSVAAWREGRLSYEDAPLAEVVADLNRYYAPGVRLASTDLGRIRVTTSFPTNEIEGFLSDLNSALPVQAEKLQNGAYRVTARDIRR